MSRVDLTRHGVIEAHAGTGKTWTIINQLVLPILQGQGCPRASIGEILLVTYTEKAAGELKKRIREGLEKRIAEIGNQPEKAELLSHLQRCLNDLHEALIGTIHGVCLRLLQSYPFETGMQFTSEMADDGAGLLACLRESIRKDWPQWGVDLSLLAESTRIEGDSGLVSRIIAVAKECLDPDTKLCTDSLAPGRDLGSIESDIRRKKELTETIVQQLRENILTIQRLNENPLGLKEGHIEELTKVLKRWNEVLAKGTFSSKSEIMGRGKKDYLANKLVKSNSAGVKQNPLISEVCGAYSDVCGSQEMEEWIGFQNLEAELSLALIIKAVPEVCRRWREKKSREGLISFQDMLSLTYNAVRENRQFRALLRSKIRFAIIDEFQDTSALQWEIFRRLFVDDANDNFSPRIFIVGDPKQSIYSFQNAVVESYLDARDSILDPQRGSGKKVLLKDNYRSLPGVIDGYNCIFTYGQESNFFLSDRISYTVENQVGIPERRAASSGQPKELSRPVRIVPLWGSSSQRRQRYARYVSSVISELKGRTVILPQGDSWMETSLDYHHFAVIAENHSLADMFLGTLLDYGIPASKYKQEGVFESSIAAEFRALLSAITEDSSVSNRLKALLTSFFNYGPEEIDPDRELSAGGPLNRLFLEWKILVDRKAWSRLFRSILTGTRVQERLLKLVDGDRRLCDLRQVMDHALEYLVRKQGSLDNLIEHLANLESGLEKPAGDQNLHAKESDRRKVQVMTMHAAKGLEFPVCFIVTGGSGGKKGFYRRWTRTADDPSETGKNIRHVMPVLSKNSLAKTPEASEKEQFAAEQQMQERRRLLYVALTRPKALLYVPMHLKNPANSETSWAHCELPSYTPEKDLTPILQEIADISLTDEKYPVCICSARSDTPVDSVPAGDKNKGPETDSDLTESLSQAQNRVYDALRQIGLPGRRRIQTSYSVLAHNQQEPADLGGRRAPDHDSGFSSPDKSEAALSSLTLPAGKHTGNALHEIMECAVSHEEGIGWADGEEIPEFLKGKTSGIIKKHGLTAGKTAEEVDRMTQNTLAIVKKALSIPYSIPESGEIRLSGLGLNDLRAEAEFHLGAAPHWVLGYMDLVFRMKNGDGSFRYFVLDWKSNWLSSYDKESIRDSIMTSRYDLQAKVYCHGLHTWLSGLLGPEYDPSRNLGGAVYVYLRALEKDPCDPVWFYKADPEEDTTFVKHEIERYAGRLTAPNFSYE